MHLDVGSRFGQKWMPTSKNRFQLTISWYDALPNLAIRLNKLEEQLPLGQCSMQWHNPPVIQILMLEFHIALNFVLIIRFMSCCRVELDSSHAFMDFTIH